VHRRIVSVILVLLLALPLFAGRGGGGSHGGSSHSAPSDGSKTVHVNGYTRKDGTYVHEHLRSAPGTARVSTPTTQQTVTSQPSVSGTVFNQTVTLPKLDHAVAKQRVSVRVLVDPRTKHYYRENCSAPASAISMSRTEAIQTGYRPDPDCYSKRTQ
jgi:hypothetical protein